MGDQKRIYYLIRQHLSDRLSAAEKDELSLLAGLSPETVETVLQQLLSEYAESEALLSLVYDESTKIRTLKNVLEIDKPVPDAGNPASRWSQSPLKQWIGLAASVLVLLSAGLYAWKNFMTPGDRPEALSEIAASEPVGYIRNIVLPDSSLVVLQAGSTLSYPDEFSGGAREVRLSGEAYFDIRPIKENHVHKPFIIHSGQLKTTVLGTSFNIKAYPDQKNIVVSVVSGKVQVENDDQVLAVLTKDQQISYQTEKAGFVEEKTEGAAATEWTRSDLEFSGESFETIAGVLERRFGITIGFTNPALANCRTFAAFSGTESLQNILETLCTIRGASYVFTTPSSVSIDGAGCDESRL